MNHRITFPNLLQKLNLDDKLQDILETVGYIDTGRKLDVFTHGCLLSKYRKRFVGLRLTLLPLESGKRLRPTKKKGEYML